MSFHAFNLSDEILSAIGFSLLHSIWQAALIALLVFVLLKLLKNATASSRYFIAFSALAMMVFLPILTFFRSYEAVEALSTASNEMTATGTLTSVVFVLAESQFGLDAFLNNTELFLIAAAPKVFWFWLLGMLVMTIRLSGGYFVAYRIKNIGVQKVTEEWQNRLNQLAAQMKIRSKISFLESKRIDMPMVIGFLKPVLLLPLGTLSRLPYDQVEMILAHELAHIKRADFLVNIFQSIVETILFFNPFVWYISAIIRQERENICDDIALHTVGKKLSLAKALVNISTDQKEAIHYNSILYFNKYNTMKRIERLFKNPQLKQSPVEKMTVTILSLIFVLFVSTSGVLTGSNVSNDLADDIGFEPIINFAPVINKDTIQQKTIKTVEPEKKTKEVEVEVVNGKTVKMIVDGVEVPAEELENEEFMWVDKDSTLTKKITIRDANGKHKTMVIKSDAVEIHQKDDGNSVFEFVTEGSGPGKEVHIIKKSGKGEGAKTEAFVWTSDDDIATDLGAPGKNKKVIFISDDDQKMEFEENFIMMETDKLAQEIDRLKLEMSKLDPNSKAEMKRLQADLEQLEADKKQLKHFRSIHIPIPPDALFPPDGPIPPDAPNREYKIERSLEDNNNFKFRFDDEIRAMDMERINSADAQYFRILRQEIEQEGIASRRSTIILSRKQLIVDNEVLDKKTHRKFLGRYEDVFGRKLESDEAVSIRR